MNSPTGGEWLAADETLQTEGVIWNDRIGDGRDRWKTGGITQSYILPERMFSDEPWIEGWASALELSARALVITPDNTAFAGVDRADRAFAQYLGLGFHMRGTSRPRTIAPDLEMQTEARAGIEFGWQGDPLPLFDIQDALHGAADTGGSAANLSNSIDNGFLVNLEARQTWRFHVDGKGQDIQFAPFVQTSLGMRENSLRVGGDVFVGSALAGRTWGADLATSAVMAGASVPRQGFNWTVFTGGDIGYVASDALVDTEGPGVARRDITGRARAGLLVEYDNVGVGFSLNWLSPEFDGQPHGQILGAVQLKYRF